MKLKGDLTQQRAARPWPWFLGLSLAIHVAALQAAGRPQPTEPAPTFDTTSGALVGDTLDVEPTSESSEDDEPAQEPSVSDEARAAPITTPPMGPGRRAHAAGSSSASAPSPPPALFGAVGVKYAADLATTFTRAFPQAASADAIWATVAYGSAGTAEVTLWLDESGHLISNSVSGNPSLALRRGIERTLLLLGPRTFTAQRAATKLVVKARVTRNDVHDGLHGDVFALSGGSFAGAVGTAFFALPPSAGPGRRIDLELRLLP